MNTNGLYIISYHIILYYIILYYIISGHMHHFPTTYSTYTSCRFGGGLNGDSSRCIVACYSAFSMSCLDTLVLIQCCVLIL